MQFIVIDFEATCDEPYNPDPQEVIEFPAVRVTKEGDGPCEFHTFIRPLAHTQLTPFCTRLTGIRQWQVDESPAFPEALERFESWRKENCPDALAVTCGDWDLGSLLPRQCRQHGLPIPGWANHWANLGRIVARQFQEDRERSSLPEMAACLGVPLVGRLHSGIDDTRNIARVLRRLLEMGVVIEDTAYWNCVGCGTRNPYRARECSACGRASIPLLPGDWTCDRCGFGNFARRDRCYDCGVARSSGGVVPDTPAAVLKRGDWICEQCNEHNFARRRTCYKCDRPRR